MRYVCKKLALRTAKKIAFWYIEIRSCYPDPPRILTSEDQWILEPRNCTKAALVKERTEDPASI